jgi:hypothetical protein
MPASPLIPPGDNPTPGSEGDSLTCTTRTDQPARMASPRPCRGRGCVTVRTAGRNGVGLGSDFDGAKMPSGREARPSCRT